MYRNHGNDDTSGGHVSPDDIKERVYRSLKCFRCGGKIEAVEFDDVFSMRVDGILHKIPMRSIPAFRCFECGTSYMDGYSDEPMQFYYQQYLNAHGLNTLWHRICRKWRGYKNRWLGWHWNRAPWAKARKNRK